MNFHSEALWREIKVHVDMGMTPQRAIAAATRVNAQIIGKGRDLGTIEPGKLADIIVVNGNPLFDIIGAVERGDRGEGRNGVQGRRRTRSREPGRRPAAANSLRASCLGLLLAAAAVQSQPPAPGAGPGAPAEHQRRNLRVHRSLRAAATTPGGRADGTSHRSGTTSR